MTVQVQNQNTPAAPVWCYYAGSETLRGGYVMCRDMAQSTAALRAYYGAKATVDNFRLPLGLVSPSFDGFVGPGWVRLDSFDGSIGASVIAWGAESFTSGDLLWVTPGLWYMAKGAVSSHAQAVAIETVDRSSTAGTVQVALGATAASAEAVTESIFPGAFTMAQDTGGANVLNDASILLLTDNTDNDGSIAYSINRIRANRAFTMQFDLNMADVSESPFFIGFTDGTTLTVDFITDANALSAMDDAVGWFKAGSAATLQAYLESGGTTAIDSDVGTLADATVVRLKVVGYGNLIYFYVNGTLVHTGTTAPAGTDLRFVAATHNEGGAITSIQISNLTIRYTA